MPFQFSDWSPASDYTNDKTASEAKAAAANAQATADAAVASVDVEYAISPSATTAPTDGWQTTAPVTTEDEPYLWTRTRTTTGAGTESTTSAVCISAGDGKGVASVTEQYYLSTSRTELAGGTWSDTASAPAEGQYVWTRSVITYTDGTSSTLAAISVSGSKGDTGDTGPRGPQGEQGVRGDTGPQGPQGTQGEKGDTGDTGPQGPKGADGQMLYATCSTAAGTAAKVATLSSGTLTLKAGVAVSVRFAHANTAASPTLNVSGTGAKAVYANGARYAYFVAGSSVTFVYDGSYWQVCSVPVYADVVTVGNPSGRNVHIDADSMDIRDGKTVLSSFGESSVSLGANSTEATVAFCGGMGKLKYSANSQQALIYGPMGAYLNYRPNPDEESDYGMGMSGPNAVVTADTFRYNGRDMYSGTVLYSSTTGTRSATLSASAAGYDFITLSMGEGTDRVSVTIGNGQTGHGVYSTITADNVVWLNFPSCTVNGTAATMNSSLYMQVVDNAIQSTGIGTGPRLYEVVGWKS